MQKKAKGQYQTGVDGPRMCYIHPVFFLSGSRKDSVYKLCPYVNVYRNSLPASPDYHWMYIRDGRLFTAVEFLPHEEDSNLEVFTYAYMKHTFSLVLHFPLFFFFFDEIVIPRSLS